MAIEISSPAQILFFRGLYGIINSSLNDLQSFECNSNKIESPSKELLNLLFRESSKFGIKSDYKLCQTGTDMRRTLNYFLEEIELPEIPTFENANLNRVVNMTSNQRGEYTDSEIIKFQVGEWICQVSNRTWKDFIKYISEIMYIEHPDVFEKIVLNNIKSERTPYFSKENNYMDFCFPEQQPEKYYPILNSGIFVRYSLSANDAANLGKVLASLFGYEKINLQVYCK